MTICIHWLLSRNRLKKKLWTLFFFLVSKELSYNEIKKEDELNSIKKPDYSTEHTGFKKKIKVLNFYH